MRASLDYDIKHERWLYAAQAAGNLSELYLTLGEVAEAVSFARQSVDFADRSGVEITSKTVQPDQKTQDGLTKISVQLSTNCTIDELVRFLVALESYEKFLRVEELYVQGPPQRNRTEIRPQIKIAGYISMQPPAAAPAEKTAGGN